MNNQWSSFSKFLRKSALLAATFSIYIVSSIAIAENPALVSSILDTASDYLDSKLNLDEIDDYFSDEDFYKNISIQYVLPLAKSLADGYLNDEVDALIQNQVEVQFSNENKYGRIDWMVGSAAFLSHKLINVLTDTAILKAVPNLLKDTGAPVLGDLSGMLFMKNHIPYSYIENKELFYLPGRGHKFVRLGAKVNNSWENFFRLMAFASSENTIDAIGIGGISAVKQHFKKLTEANGAGNSSASYTQQARRAVVDHLKEVAVFIGNKIINKIVTISLKKFKQTILPYEQITGFYTIKDGVIYHVHYAADTTKLLEIEKSVSMLGMNAFISAKKFKINTDLGWVKIAGPVLAKKSFEEKAVEALRGSALFAVESLFEFYMKYSKEKLYDGANYLSGKRVGSWFYINDKNDDVLGHNKNFFSRLYNEMASSITSRVSALVDGSILSPIWLPIFRSIFIKIAAKKKLNQRIMGVTKIDGEFYFVEVTDKYMDFLQTQVEQARQSAEPSKQP